MEGNEPAVECVRCVSPLDVGEFRRMDDGGVLCRPCYDDLFDDFGACEEPQP